MCGENKDCGCGDGLTTMKSAKERTKGDKSSPIVASVRTKALTDSAQLKNSSKKNDDKVFAARKAAIARRLARKG